MDYTFWILAPNICFDLALLWSSDVGWGCVILFSDFLILLWFCEIKISSEIGSLFELWKKRQNSKSVVHMNTESLRHLYRFVKIFSAILSICLSVHSFVCYGFWPPSRGPISNLSPFLESSHHGGGFKIVWGAIGAEIKKFS